MDQIKFVIDSNNNDTEIPEDLPEEQASQLKVTQSDPMFVPTSSLMKTPAPSTNNPAQEEQLQKYQERKEKLSQQDRVSKFCTRAGFLTTVDVGQYFMTKDTDEFLQSTEPVTCRENTLPRDETSTDPKGWIRGNTKIGPVLESHNQLPTR